MSSRPGPPYPARHRRAGAKAEKAVAGKRPSKRNRFVQLSGGTKKVNRALEDKTRALAGLKGYITNLAARPGSTPVTAGFVIGAYHQLFQIEKSFRMSKLILTVPAGIEDFWASPRNVDTSP